MASSAELKKRKKKKEEEKKTYENRKKEVDKIIKKIESDFPSPIGKINSKIEECSSSYSAGLKGAKAGIASDIRDEWEKSASADSFISASSANLSNESARCQRKIADLKAEIDSLEREIKAAEERERREREERKKAQS